MYVYEEVINGKKLTEIINETHENVKYLPGHKLPENVVSTAVVAVLCNNILLFNQCALVLLAEHYITVLLIIFNVPVVQRLLIAYLICL